MQEYWQFALDLGLYKSFWLANWSIGAILWTDSSVVTFSSSIRWVFMEEGGL